MTTDPPAAPFGARLRAAMDTHGPLCVGIDPHPELLTAWGLPVTARGLETFAMTCVDAFAGQVAVVKPQSAFFERFGSAGVAVLERALAGLREGGTLSLLDVKRGDIDSTMEAYAQAHLSDESPLAADAITLAPYVGYAALRPAVDQAHRTGRGLFVLALTSNPEGVEVQHRGGAGHSVAGTVVAGVTADNADSSVHGAGTAGTGQLGSIGMVVGATVGDAVQRLRLDLGAAGGPLLAPGLGAQGAGADDLEQVFGGALHQVLASTSRTVLSAGPGVAGLRAGARHTGEQVAALLGAR